MIDGNNSTTQKSENSVIIIMLKVFICGVKHVRLITSNASRITIIIALPSTPHQNSRREEVPR